jgi:hypothetical protein
MGRLKKTERGFLREEFKDIYGHPCSIQESSLATEDAVWLGCDEGTHHHVTGECLARMHVDKKLAKQIVKRLLVFIETGRLKKRAPR